MSRILFLTALLFAFFSFFSASGATWYLDGSVPASSDGTSWESAFKTIQEGIDASSDGDTVLVAEGTYVENIYFNGKNIILTSTDPLDSTVVANTIIDGNKSHSVVSFSSRENEACVLSGFTITNGLDYYGGGICGWETRATISNNVIKGNSATRGKSSFGGGLYRCGGLIQNNLIYGNSAAKGGGLFLCNGIIENNTITCNSATLEGGGLMYCQADIRNCIIWGNEPGPQLDTWRSLNYSCVERWRGGGKGNIAYYPYFVDAAQRDYHLRSYSPCIDAGDQASPFLREPEPNGGRINIGVYGNTSEAAFRSGDTDDDRLPDDWEIEFLGDLSHNSTDDPDGDAMSNLEEYRYGYDPTTPADVWYVDAPVSASGDGRSWQTAFKTIQEGINAASDRDTVIVAEATYVENIYFDGKDIVLRSREPLDSDVVANTTIDGGGVEAVVTFQGTETALCVLSGFTIRNGEGVGISGTRSSAYTVATISHNVVTANSGEGLYGCNGLIRNNIICRNDGGWYGGGLTDCEGIIENNTIYGNSAEDCGGALASCGGTIRNCIIWGNTERELIYESSLPTYSCIEGWIGGGVGNTSHHPHFQDAANGDFHLKSWSPCVDAGDPTSSFLREPLPNGGRINMGAYGNTPEATSKSPDSDHDKLPDQWETEFLGTLIHTPLDDPDGDLMSNMEEYERGLNPAIPANTWHVDGSVAGSGDGRSWETAFRRIQEGIDAASEGDTVIVAKGTYAENVHFHGRNITLTGKDPLDPEVVASTVIDGRLSGSAVTFTTRERERCVLSGFTIRNGRANQGGGICGGTSGCHSRPLIEHNVVTGNVAQGIGGGIAFCDGTVQRNAITQNSAEDRGGGLYRCDGLVLGNTIIGNTSSSLGGGLDFCMGVIEGNTIKENRSSSAGGGLSDCSGAIRGNTILENTALTGGGLWRCHGPIVNNVVVRNTAESDGGGLSECEGPVQNNTICGNAALSYYGGGLYLVSGIISNCIIYDNTAGASGLELYDSSDPQFSCIQGFSGGVGNISENPHLGSDYRLLPDSPCIDVGANEEWMWSATDLDGNPRIFYGGLSLAVDMGAYEYGSFPFRVVGVSGNNGEDAELTWNSRPGHAYTVWSCENLLAGSWTEEETVPSGGDTTVWIDPDTTSSRKFYRIEFR